VITLILILLLSLGLKTNIVLFETLVFSDDTLICHIWRQKPHHEQDYGLSYLSWGNECALLAVDSATHVWISSVTHRFRDNVRYRTKPTLFRAFWAILAELHITIKPCRTE
jgi:hypothetical protein